MPNYIGDSLFAGETSQIEPGRVRLPWLLSMLRGDPPPNVLALGGDTLANQTRRIYAAPRDESFVLIGTNDRILYRNSGVTDPNGIALFKNELTAVSYWMAGLMFTARSAGWTFGPAWTNYVPGHPWAQIGKYAAASGASASVHFDGDVLLIGYTMIDGGACGAATVNVNGNPVGTINCNPPRAISAGPTYSAYAPGVFRASGFGAASRGNVAQLVTTNAGYVSIDWIWDGVTMGAPVHLLTLPRTGNGDDAEVAAYNAVPYQVAAQCAADGFAVDVIDTGSVVRPIEMCLNSAPLTNNAHPNTHGDMNMVAEIMRALAA